MTTLLWLRRDLRRSDHPALTAAAADGPVLACFVLDPALLSDAGPVRTGWLAACLRATDGAYDGRLCLRSGTPEDVIPALAAEVGASAVHVSTETEPVGASRDARVREALDGRGIGWVETGSPYAVTPGRVRSRSGDGFAVFSAFLRRWREHGWPSPAVEPDGLHLLSHRGDEDAWSRLDAAATACPVRFHTRARTPP